MLGQSSKISERLCSELQGRSAASKQHEDMQTDVKPVTGLRVLCVRRMGSLPVQLPSLKSLVSLPSHMQSEQHAPISNAHILCPAVTHATPYAEQ